MDDPLSAVGQAGFCAVVEGCPDVIDALVVDAGEPAQRGVRMLFVVMRPGKVLDDVLRVEINARLRADDATRRMPDAICVAPGLPRAPGGKKHVEAVRRILTGVRWEDAGEWEAVMNPEALGYFRDLIDNL